MAIIAWGHFAHDIYTSFFAPLLPLLRDTIGLSYTDAGVLTALQRLPALLNPALGVVADRTSVRWMLVSAPTITALAMSCIGIADSREALAIMLLVSGVGSSIWHVPAPVLLARVSGGRIGLGMSLFMVAGEVSRSIGPFLVLGVVSLWGPAGLLRLIPLGLATSLLLFAATAGLDDAAKPARKRRAAGDSRRQLTLFFGAIALLIGGRSFLVAALPTFLPSFVIERGGSLWLGGAALGILQAAGAVGALSSGTLSDRFSRRSVLLFVALCSPPAMVALALAPTAAMLPLLILIGLLAFSTNPPLLALVQERVAHRPAVGNAIFMTLGFVLRSAVVVVVGLMADAFGLRQAFLISGIAALTSIPAVLLLPRGSGTVARE